jgi:hypothetical protein
MPPDLEPNTVKESRRQCNFGRLISMRIIVGIGWTMTVTEFHKKARIGEAMRDIVNGQYYATHPDGKSIVPVKIVGE